MMHLVSVSRRRVLLGGGVLALAPLLPEPLFAEPATSDLRAITGGAVPISVAEREGRIERARRLMREHRIDAILIEPGRALLILPGLSGGGVSG